MPKRSLDIAVFDRIQRWVTSPEEFSKLHPEDNEIYNRWSFADDLLRRYPSRKDCANMMMKKYNYSLATAYRDISYAQQLFGTINAYNKEYIKNFIIEDIFRLMAKAKEVSDLKAWSAAHANLIKAVGLDREEKNIIDPEQLEQHNYFAILAAAGQVLKIDLNNLEDLPDERKHQLVNKITEVMTEDIAFELIESSKYEKTKPDTDPA